MIRERSVKHKFWVEFIHIVVVILNKSHFIPNSEKTPYELWYGKTTTIKYLRVFGSKCYIKQNNKKLGKFDEREDEGIFLGYFQNNKGYRCYNKNTKKNVDCIDGQVDEYIEFEDS